MCHQLVVTLACQCSDVVLSWDVITSGCTVAVYTLRPHKDRIEVLFLCMDKTSRTSTPDISSSTSHVYSTICTLDHSSVSDYSPAPCPIPSPPTPSISGIISQASPAVQFYDSSMLSSGLGLQPSVHQPWLLSRPVCVLHLQVFLQ